MSTADEDLLADYLARALEARANGDTVDPLRLCADHPQFATAVADAMCIAPLLPDWHASAQRVDPRVGARIAERYELEQRVGAGAMGVVYRAMDLELRREVAIKLLARDLFAHPSAETRFLREAEALAAVSHPHVVPVFDRGRSEDGTLFLVMAWVPGVSLAEVLAWATERSARGASIAATDWLAERLPPPARLETSYVRQCARLCSEIAAGLAAAHASGIVHRDVKPSNVWVDTHGRAKLLDFGIARRITDPAHTAHGTSLGTPWYMPPEQAAGDREPTPQNDVYALGATLYHLLALVPPFDDTPMRVLARVLRDEPKRLTAIRPDTPRDLAAIVEHAMQREPSRRYPSAREMHADLIAFCDHRPVTARPIGPLARWARRVRRHPARAVAIGASLAMLAWLPVWRAQVAADDEREYRQLVAGLPALSSFESYPEKRVEVDVEESARHIATLHRILELRADDASSRLALAASLQDAGRHDAAARQVELLVRHAPPCEYLRELAARYRAVVEAPPTSVGADVLALDGMPEPTTDGGRFAAAFHVFRSRAARDYAQADAWLGSAGDYPPAKDLRLIALLATGAFAAAHDAALTLEGVYGQATARTRHVIGAARVGLGRYADAIGPLEDSLALRSDRHGPLHNLGIAHFRLGELERAAELLERAHAIRPWLWNTLHELAKVRTRQGRHAEALAFAERIPTTGTMGEAWHRALAIARASLHRAIAEHFAGDRERAVASARCALEQFEVARASGAPSRTHAGIECESAFLDALCADDESSLFTRFLAIAAGDPLQPELIENLALYVPANGLDAEQADGLRDLLRAQASSLGKAAR